SITSRLFLNKYWTWLVTLIPTTVAPNTVTLTGLSLVGLNFLTLLYYDPLYLSEKSGATGPPDWMYWVWGVSLFLYQSLDAIDGKQARRTGMAGPLGEMFDHGCDAINTTLEVILASRALNLARSRWTVSSQMAAIANFYLTTWEEYHTGTLYLGVFNGPTEGILLIVGIYFMTAMYGTEVWDKDVFITLGLHKVKFLTDNLPHYRFNEAFMAFGAVGVSWNVVTSYYNVYKHEKAAGRSVLLPILRLMPMPISIGLNLLWLSYPTYDDSAIIHSSLFIPFLCAWGLQFAHQVGLMILAHVTSQPFPLFDGMWLWTAALAMDLNAEWLFDKQPIFQTTPERRAIAVYATLLLTLASYGRFVYSVINDITDYLGIACFTVRKRDKEGHWEDAKKVDAQKKEL
ncbi:hypothetical protein FRC14_001340, partial [Serendipita sp. 396]